MCESTNNLPIGGEPDPLVARLATMRSSVPRHVEQQVFYEMGFQAGCRLTSVSLHAPARWMSSARFIAMTAACLCLAAVGGFAVGQWRSVDSVAHSPDTIAQSHSEPTKDNTDSNNTDNNVELQPIVRPEPESSVARVSYSIPTWWPWLARPQTAQYGFQIGPIGADWEDLVVCVAPPAQSPNAEFERLPQLLESEFQEMLPGAVRLDRSRHMERIKNMFVPEWL